MYHDHLKVVNETLAQARGRRSLQDLGDEMLQLFLEQHPEAISSFEGFDLKALAPHKFCKVSDALVDVLKFPEYSESSLSEEVFRHQIYDVKDKEYYFALADALVATIRNTLADVWDLEMEESWADTISGLHHNIDLAAREHLSRNQ
jgi:hemoglobin-like flavoprotein